MYCVIPVSETPSPLVDTLFGCNVRDNTDHSESSSAACSCDVPLRARSVS